MKENIFIEFDQTPINHNNIRRHIIKGADLNEHVEKFGGKCSPLDLIIIMIENKVDFLFDVIDFSKVSDEVKLAALYTACLHGNIPAVTLLAPQCKEYINYPSKNSNNTALDYARMSNTHLSQKSEKVMAELVNTLSSFGAEPQQSNTIKNPTTGISAQIITQTVPIGSDKANPLTSMARVRAEAVVSSVQLSP
jgi:hypothetical protein